MKGKKFLIYYTNVKQVYKPYYLKQPGGMVMKKIFRRLIATALSMAVVLSNTTYVSIVNAESDDIIGKETSIYAYSATNGSIRVGWNELPEANNYTLYIKGVNEDTYTPIEVGEFTFRYTITGLDPCSLYELYVVPSFIDEDGTITYGEKSHRSTQIATAPVDTQITSFDINDDGSFSMSWEAVECDGYNISYKKRDGSWICIGHTEDANMCSLTTEVLEPDTEYWFCVQPFKVSPSNSVMATKYTAVYPPLTEDGVKISADNLGSIETIELSLEDRGGVMYIGWGSESGAQDYILRRYNIDNPDKCVQQSPGTTDKNKICHWHKAGTVVLYEIILTEETENGIRTVAKSPKTYGMRAPVISNINAEVRDFENVEITWKDSGISSSYTIMLDGQVIDTIDASKTSYTIKGLDLNKDYTVSVQAKSEITLDNGTHLEKDSEIISTQFKTGFKIDIDRDLVWEIHKSRREFNNAAKSVWSVSSLEEAATIRAFEQMELKGDIRPDGRDATTVFEDTQLDRCMGAGAEVLLYDYKTTAEVMEVLKSDPVYRMMIYSNMFGNISCSHITDMDDNDYWVILFYGSN